MNLILNSPQHKLACLALYKAFLTHCRKLPCPSLQQDAVNHIKKQFQKNRRIQTVKSVQQVLLAAYQHESILRKAAVGDQSCVEAVRAHLDTIATINKPSPPKPKPPSPSPPIKISRLEEKKQEKLPQANTQKGPVAWQPNHLRIPTLSSANALPLLRIPGQTTPQHVAMTIKKIVKLRQRRQDMLEILEEHLEYAHGEDLWDAEIAKYIKPPAEYQQVRSWAEETTGSIEYLNDAMRRRDEKSKALINKFWNIEVRARKKNERLVQERRREKRRRERHNRWKRTKALEKQEEDADIKGMDNLRKLAKP